MKPSDLLIVAPCFGTDNGAQRIVEPFMRSAKGQSVPICLYGLNQPYTNWQQVKSDALIPLLEKNKDSFTHVFYTDAFDALWLQPVDTLLARYNFYSSPPLLVAAESEPFPQGDWPTRRGMFLNAGGFMGRLPYVLWALKEMRGLYSEKSGNDQHWWQWAWKAGWLDIELDCYRYIWHTMSGNGQKAMEQSKVLPCVLHFNGGSGNVQEWAKRLGI